MFVSEQGFIFFIRTALYVDLPSSDGLNIFFLLLFAITHAFPLYGLVMMMWCNIELLGWLLLLFEWHKIFMQQSVTITKDLQIFMFFFHFHSLDLLLSLTLSLSFSLSLSFLLANSQTFIDNFKVNTIKTTRKKAFKWMKYWKCHRGGH